MRGQEDTRGVVVLVGADGRERVVGELPARSDLDLVDALMRSQLVAGRGGSRLRLRRPSPELLALLELAGLSGVLGLEPQREVEVGEHRGADEVVQPGDPPA